MIRKYNWSTCVLLSQLLFLKLIIARHYVHLTPQSITFCTPASFEHIFRNWENQFRSGKPKIIQARDPSLGRTFFQGLPLDHTDKTLLLIRYCLSLSGIMTFSATNTGQMVRFILLLFSIKPNSIWLSAYFLNLAGLGLTSVDDMDRVLHENSVEMSKQQSCDWLIDSWLRLL